VEWACQVVGGCAAEHDVKGLKRLATLKGPRVTCAVVRIQCVGFEVCCFCGFHSFL
jgi:hypothetical protein